MLLQELLIAYLSFLIVGIPAGLVLGIVAYAVEVAWLRYKRRPIPTWREFWNID